MLVCTLSSPYRFGAFTLYFRLNGQTATSDLYAQLSSAQLLRLMNSKAADQQEVPVFKLTLCVESLDRLKL